MLTDDSRTSSEIAKKTSKNSEEYSSPASKNITPQSQQVDSPHFSNRKKNNAIANNANPNILGKRKLNDEKEGKPLKSKLEKIENNLDHRSPNKPRQRTVKKNENSEGSSGIPTSVVSTSVKHRSAKPTEHVFSPKMTRSRMAKKSSLSFPQLDGGDDSVKKKTKSKQSSKSSKRRKESDNSDSDFEPVSKEVKKRPTPVQNLKSKIKPSSKLIDRVKATDRRVFSTDEEDNEQTFDTISNGKAINFWPEVYCEKEQKWIAIDLRKSKINDVQSIVVGIYTDETIDCCIDI